MNIINDDSQNERRSLRTEIRAVCEFSGELEDFIRRSNDREFGNDSMVYDIPEWYALGFLEKEPVTHAGILHRNIIIGGTPLQIGGISFVVTEPDFRGRGYARVIMDQAIAFVKDDLGLSFCLLTCKPRLESLYTGWGWQTVPGPTVFMQPSGPRGCGGLTMIYRCTEKAWPDGKIDLCGLPW